MKKLLFITNVVVVNIALLVTTIELFNPFNKTLGFLLTHNIEWFFSPDPVYNIGMISNFIGLITFNTVLIIKRKNKKS